LHSSKNFGKLDGFVKVIEAKLPRPFPKGFNRNVKAMRLMLDPVVVFFIYLFIIIF